MAAAQDRALRLLLVAICAATETGASSQWIVAEQHASCTSACTARGGGGAAACVELALWPDSAAAFEAALPQSFRDSRCGGLSVPPFAAAYRTYHPAVSVAGEDAGGRFAACVVNGGAVAVDGGRCAVESPTGWRRLCPCTGLPPTAGPTAAPSNPSVRPTQSPTVACPVVKREKNCDEWAAAAPEYTCAYMTNAGYDCSGCTCTSAPTPVPTSAPSVPRPTLHEPTGNTLHAAIGAAAGGVVALAAFLALLRARKRRGKRRAALAAAAAAANRAQLEAEAEAVAATAAEKAKAEAEEEEEAATAPAAASRHRRRLSSSTKRRDRWAEAFSKVDHDGNGLLSYGEFMAVCMSGHQGSAMARVLAEKEATTLFDLLDENKNGSIDLHELRHALQHNEQACGLACRFGALHDLVEAAELKHQKEAFRAAVRGLSADGGGHLGFGALRAACCGNGSGDDDDADLRELFALVDADHDETLDAHELSACLRHDERARALAGRFPALRALVGLADARKHRHKSSHHKHKLKRKASAAVMVKIKARKSARHKEHSRRRRSSSGGRRKRKGTMHTIAPPRKIIPESTAGPRARHKPAGLMTAVRVGAWARRAKDRARNQHSLTGAGL